jgi:excisionase family DNA binding protein
MAKSDPGPSVTHPNRAARRHPEPFTGLAGAAAYLDTSPKTVRRLIASKRLPASRLNRTWKIRYADLDALIDAGAA